MPSPNNRDIELSLGTELLGIELLEEYGRHLAALFIVSRRPVRNGRTHLRRLNENRKALRTTYRALAEDVRHGDRVPLGSIAHGWTVCPPRHRLPYGVLGGRMRRWPVPDHDHDAVCRRARGVPDAQSPGP